MREKTTFRNKTPVVLGIFGAVVVVLLAWVGLSNASRATSGTVSRSSVEVQIQLSEYAVQSNVKTFERGVPYHFSVSNIGTLSHELMVMPKMTEANMNHMSMQDMHTMDFFDIDLVPPGQTKTMNYLFSSTAKTGTIELSCHLSNHYQMGMHLDIPLN